MNDTQPTIDEIKKLLLGQGKKQYEFVKYIFTPAELLAEKPFVLLSLLNLRLNLSRDIINPKYFRQWLSNYRKKTGEKKKIFNPGASLKDPISRNSYENKFDTKFQFTDPSTLKKKEETLIRFVGRDD